MRTPVRRAPIVLTAVLATFALACGGSRGNPEVAPAGSADASVQEGTGRRRGCATIDSVMLAYAPVYAECEVERRARLKRPLIVNFTPQRGDPVRCFRTVFDIVIDAAGDPIKESIKINRNTSSAFHEAVLSALLSASYTPAEKDGAAVKQIVRIDQAMQIMRSSGQGSAPIVTRPNC